MMTPRDKAILSNLERFRVMSRDDIADIHFTNVKHPATQVNMVMKRLRRDGYVEANTNYRKYLYFPAPAPIKKDSAKIPHFLRIVDFYKQLRAIEEPRVIEVEPKYGKGNPEPDLFVIWKNAPAFVEIQRSVVYSPKQIEEKMTRYEAYYHSDEWHTLPWQPRDRAPIFPRVWIVGEQQFNVEVPFRVVQTRAAEEILALMKR